MNKVILIGNVGKDPEVTTFKNGDRIATLSLATSEKYKDKQGQSQEVTEWHRVKFNGKMVDIVEKWVKKGDKIVVEGKIHYSKKENNGVTTYFTDILCRDMTMLTPKQQGNQNQLSQSNGTSGSLTDAEVVREKVYHPF
jgi:single-strand DNA-binding protein